MYFCWLHSLCKVFTPEHKKVRAEVSPPGAEVSPPGLTNGRSRAQTQPTLLAFSTAGDTFIHSKLLQPEHGEIKFREKPNSSLGVYFWIVCLTSSPFVSNLGCECTAGGPLYPPRSVGNICDAVCAHNDGRKCVLMCFATETH